MMSIIALVLWEGMVLIVASQFIKAFSQDGDSGEKTWAAIISTIVVLGLAFLPFSGAF